MPAEVWRINLDVPEESKTVSLDNTEDRWWEQEDLQKLILASNQLTSISEDIKLLPALSLLDVEANIYIICILYMIQYLFINMHF